MPHAEQRLNDATGPGQTKSPLFFCTSAGRSALTIYRKIENHNRFEMGPCSGRGSQFSWPRPNTPPCLSSRIPLAQTTTSPLAHASSTGGVTSSPSFSSEQCCPTCASRASDSIPAGSRNAPAPNEPIPPPLRDAPAMNTNSLRSHCRPARARPASLVHFEPHPAIAAHRPWSPPQALADPYPIYSTTAVSKCQHPILDPPHVCLLCFLVATRA